MSSSFSRPKLVPGSRRGFPHVHPAPRASRLIAEPTHDQRRRFISELREAKRRPLDPEESYLAEQVARRVHALHGAGASWNVALGDIDATWPSLPYRVAVVGLFWAQRIFDKKRRGRS
jgi:hypothetical protein